LTSDFTDLYRHGARLNTVAKRFFTEFKKCEESEDFEMMRCWAECYRKITMNIVEIAKTVLSVEELIKGKTVRSYE